MSSGALAFIMTVGGIVLSIVDPVLSVLFYRWVDAQAKSSDSTPIGLRAATEGLQHRSAVDV
jgi:hypothetical protein